MQILQWKQLNKKFEGTVHNESKVNVKINKNGDLIHKCYLDIKFPEFHIKWWYLY